MGSCFSDTSGDDDESGVQHEYANVPDQICAEGYLADRRRSEIMKITRDRDLEPFDSDCKPGETFEEYFARFNKWYFNAKQLSGQ